ARVTSSRSSSMVSPTVCFGSKAATTGSIMRPTASRSYIALRCHWRAKSGGAAEIARSRASLGSSSSTSCANPGLRWTSSLASAEPGSLASLAAAPPGERALMSSARSTIPLSDLSIPLSLFRALYAFPLVDVQRLFVEIRLVSDFIDRTTAIFSWHNLPAMTPRAITIRPAEPRDAQAIAAMSRDFIESGLGWKYDAARVLRAMRDRETLAVVACEGAKGAMRGAVAGFAIMEF